MAHLKKLKTSTAYYFIMKDKLVAFYCTLMRKHPRVERENL